MKHSYVTNSNPDFVKGLVEPMKGHSAESELTGKQLSRGFGESYEPSLSSPEPTEVAEIEGIRTNEDGSVSDLNADTLRVSICVNGSLQTRTFYVAD